MLKRAFEQSKRHVTTSGCSRTDVTKEWACRPFAIPCCQPRRRAMNMDVIKTFTEQMQGFAAPLTRYNQLLASNIEQLTRLQLASANAYAELGLSQLQAVGKVQDAQSLAA